MELLHVGITTAPRKTDYLPALLQPMPSFVRVTIAPTTPNDAFRCRGLAAVMAESGRSVEVLQSLETDDAQHPDLEHRRCLERNTDRLIDHLCERSEFFLTLQDDCAPCLNAYRRVLQIRDWMAKAPDVGWVSFYTPYRQCGFWPDALWPYPPNKFYGEIALLWNRNAAAEFVAKSDISMAHDLAIQKHFSNAKWRVYGHSPCLFQHIGVDSATGKPWTKGQRVTMNFHENKDAVRAAKRLPQTPPALVRSR